jgi:hypothetical protein
MRVGLLVVVWVVSVLLVAAQQPAVAFAIPLGGGFSSAGERRDLRLIEDTCWWWGTRWQYGWRGYGWYPCWDWPKPMPSVIAPEAVPQPPLSAEPCLQSARDSAGHWHSRRVC